MKARAAIEFLAEVDGGLATSMLSPCQSLLMHFAASPEEGGGIDLGVRITATSSDRLMPGMAQDVTLAFWSDVADLHVLPGKRFELRYPIRVVGHGVVLEVIPF